jgi:hypothetical protein
MKSSQLPRSAGAVAAPVQESRKGRARIAGHASEEMTKSYQRDHAKVVWSEAVPDLDISEIAG